MSTQKRRHLFSYLCLVLFSIVLILQQNAVAATQRTVTDMRGKKIQLPAKINRVITLDDGFTGGIMTSLGLQDKLIALGSHCPTKIFKYTYPTTDGEEYSYLDGMNPVGFLTPALRKLPYMATYGQSTNIEEIARLNPDLVIMRIGSCYASNDSEILDRQISMIESIGIPLIILNSPGTFSTPTVKNISTEIKLIGKVFDKQKETTALANYLEETVEMIRSRTEHLKESEKPTAILFGLSPKARGKGAAGTIHGKDTIESFFLENIVKAINPYQGSGSFTMVNIEQVFTMDPDVIILPTAWGYHPPSELYTAPYYQNLSELKAVKNRRVVALPWTPCNCEKRIEYPIELMIMAKACHPELFKDIAVHEWVLDFYQKIYGVDRATAKGLRSAQWLDWTVDQQW